MRETEEAGRSAGDGLMTLAAEHSALEACFERHQVALLERRFEEAARALREYASSLERHMRAEEELLLPLFCARVSPVRGASVELFTGEHARLRQLLAEAAERVTGFAATPPPGRVLLGLLEREYLFKQLTEHHHLREERYLFPHLDQATTGEERRQLLSRFLDITQRG